MTRVRDLATILGRTEAVNISNTALGTGSGSGGLDSAQVLSISGTGSTFRDSSSNPILNIEAGTRLYHSGWTDSAGTTNHPRINSAQLRKGSLVHVASNLTHFGSSDAAQAARERQQYMYQNVFCVVPTANTGIDILRYTMLDRSDDAVPSANEIYNRVNWICWAGGHTNATGSGANHTIGTIDYNGASPTNGTSHSHADGNSPSFAWTHSNYVSTLNIQGSGASSNVGYFTVFVQILFTHGAGPRGSAVYYKLEELV